MKIPEEIDLRLYAKPSKMENLLALVEDPRNLVAADDQPKLFEPMYRKVLLEYLRHHSLAEKNHDLLFHPENADVLEFFVAHQSLESRCEARLFEVEYRPLLKIYFERGCLADAENELLLFGCGLSMYRRLYLKLHALHNRDAEAQLFEEEFAYELGLYVENEHCFFPDFVSILAEEHLELYGQYCQYAT